MADLTPQQVFDEMPNKFVPERAKGVNAVIQFNLSGDNGGLWHLTVADGVASTAAGTAENPNVTISIASTDFVNLITGKVNGMQLFMSGKIKLTGDMMLANSMMNWFQM